MTTQKHIFLIEKRTLYKQTKVAKTKILSTEEAGEITEHKNKC